MSCSIPTGKSNSKWLDRLRSLKGFPTGADLDLETFLSRQKPELFNPSDAKLAESAVDKIVSSPNADSSQAREMVDQKQPAEIPREDGEKEPYDVISNMLAELFCMGESKDTSKVNRKKTSRKQRNPKIFLVSNPSKLGEVASSVPLNSSRIGTKGKGEQRSIVELEDGVDVDPVDCEEEDKFPPDLSGFSRMAVTIRDTSCPSWKFDKILYKKKNVFIARDIKGKQLNIGRKRKLIPLEDNDGTEKKLKVSVGQCSSSKEANGEEINMALHQENNQGNTKDESCKQFPPKKRFAGKSKTGGSSGVVIKDTPTGKKSNRVGPKNPMK